MPNAPAVTYPVGRSRFQGQLTAALLVLGGVAGAWWSYAVDPPGWRQGAFWVTWLLTGWTGLRALWRTPQVVLAWDGQAWHCRHAAMGADGDGNVVVEGATDARVGSTVRLHLDLQFFMLISVHSDAGCQWLWPERRSAPAAWLALRRAVMASAAHAGSPPDTASSAMLKP